MVGHAAVLAEASREYAGTKPVLRDSDGLPIVTYRRTRVYVDRDAWEMLPPGAVLFMRVRPRDEPGLDLVFTAEELEDVFGEVRRQGSWDQIRCVHFKDHPRAVESFRVGNPIPPSAAVTSTAGGRTPASGNAGSRRLPRSVARPVSELPSSRLDWARECFEQLGVPSESDEYESDDYLTGVERWREAWRPPKLKALLVAESHVTQVDGDDQVKVRIDPRAERAARAAERVRAARLLPGIRQR